MKLSTILLLGLLGTSVQAVGIKSQLNDFNGADVDEIMDKVFSKYSIEGTDHNGVKNG